MTINANTIVAYLNRNSIRRNVDREMDAPARIRIFRGVAQEINNHPSEIQAVRENER
jgi:hypothetical protein